MTDTTINIEKAAKSRLSEMDVENLKFGRVFSDHMLIAEYKDGKWQSAAIKPYEEVSMSPAIAGLHYGISIFEGMKAYKNKDGGVQLFRPYENYTRMNRSGKRLCMPEIPKHLFIEGITELVKLDKDWIPDVPGGTLYIRPLYFASDEYIGIQPPTSFKFMIMCCPVGLYYTAPVNVLVNTDNVRSFKGGVGEYKVAGNYAPTLLPIKEANEKGYNNNLWMNAINPKLIEEIGTMNVFFVVDNVVITPGLKGTILEGITRDSCIKLLQDEGYTVQQRGINIEELVDAYDRGTFQEAFGAGTAASISHIAKIGYEGKDMFLPPVEDRKVSNFLADRLDGIKTSRYEDPYGWIHKIA
ncbi:branched-chain amino acid aminotransferase [bacterium AH-315-C07]|nr:branched-chain amino acid aminotransferase [bacterium AH-315-C07]